MPYVNQGDYNERMRRYRRKNADRINEQRAEREAWKRIAEDDERRGRVSESLDALLSDEDSAYVAKVYHLLRQCTPTMLEELVARAKKLT